MRVIDRDETEQKKSTSVPLDSLVNTLKFGRGWSDDMQAQEGVIASLQKVLDNRYMMLRNVVLEGLEIPIPLILVGPPGARVLYPSASRGVYRAKGDVWEKIDDRQQVFRPSQPNFMARATLMSRAVDAFLQGRGFKTAQVEPVLMFTDPGTHVELIRPQVRIVLVDGIERFVAGLQQSRTVLEQEDVQNVVDVLNKEAGQSEAEGEMHIERDAFSFTDEPGGASKGVMAAPMSSVDQALNSLSSKIHFSKKQWIVIGLLIIVNIIILIALAVLLLISV